MLTYPIAKSAMRPINEVKSRTLTNLIGLKRKVVTGFHRHRDAHLARKDKLYLCLAVAPSYLSAQTAISQSPALTNRRHTPGHGGEGRILIARLRLAKVRGTIPCSR